MRSRRGGGAPPWGLIPLRGAAAVFSRKPKVSKVSFFLSSLKRRTYLRRLEEKTTQKPLGQSSAPSGPFKRGTVSVTEVKLSFGRSGALPSKRASPPSPQSECVCATPHWPRMATSLPSAAVFLEGSSSLPSSSVDPRP